MNVSLLHGLWQSPWLERVGWTLLHFLWQGTLVAAVLAAVLGGLLQAPARNRYLVSVTGAAAACLFPLLTFLTLPLPAGLPTASLRREMARPPVARALVQGLPPLAAPLPLPAATAPANSLGLRQPVQGRNTPGFRQAYRTVIERARPLLPWCAALWAVGVAVLSLRLLAGWTQVQRLRRRGTVPADGRWQARLEGLARRLGIRRAVRLLESTLAEVPAVIGWLRPVVLVPVGVLAGLSTAQVEMILAHELAHVRRQDYVVNLGLTLFETFGFYHPAVWWIARCVRAEREHACDDLAVSACGGDRVGYVRALATLEEMRGPAGQFALAASGGGRGLLLARVRRLLGVTPERRPRTGRATWWLAGAIALLAALATILGGVQRPAQAQETLGTPSRPPAATPHSTVDAAPNPSPAPTAEMLTAFVKVVDEDGKPIVGVKITPDLLRIRAVPDSVYDWRDDRYGPTAPAFTDAGGIAAVRYPRYVDESWPTGAIIFETERSGYCPAFVYDYYAIVDDPAKAEPVVLRRGATLRLRGHLPGSDRTVPVCPQQEVPPGQTDKTQAPLSPNAWNDVGDNTLATNELSIGPSCVRAAHAAANGTLYFSEAQLLSAEPGKTYTLDLELKPGVRVEGHLDASVPRPVRAGRVVVHVSATGSDKRLAWLGWDSWRDVAADGTFVFESLPPGNVKLMAVCEGYTSAGLPDHAGSHVVQLPQCFESLAGQTIQANIKMQTEAVCTVAVRDAAGAPVAGAQVNFFPGAQLLPPGLSTSFCLPSFKQEEFVSRWRTGDRLPGDRFAGAFFQAISDERGIATVHNLPAERDTVFNVTANGYKSVPPTRRGKQWHVDLVAGAKTNAEMRLEKIGTPSLDEKEPGTPTPEPTPPAPTLRSLEVTPEIKKAFANGESIEIRAITGTASHFQVGGTYRVVGVCRQQSLDHATLYVGNTAEPGSAAIAPAAGSSLDTALPRGSTEFDCTFKLLRPGVLHATVYDLDNHDKNDNAYAGVYLGKVLPAEDPPPR